MRVWVLVVKTSKLGMLWILTFFILPFSLGFLGFPNLELEFGVRGVWVFIFRDFKVILRSPLYNFACSEVTKNSWKGGGGEDGVIVIYFYFEPPSPLVSYAS